MMDVTKVVDRLRADLVQMQVELEEIVIDGETFRQQAEPDLNDAASNESLVAEELTKTCRTQERLRFLIANTEHVLERFENGWKGECACGEQIPVERLTASPGTEECVACAERHERDGKGGFHWDFSQLAHA